MARLANPNPAGPLDGDEISLNGDVRRVVRHESDFTVLRAARTDALPVGAAARAPEVAAAVEEAVATVDAAQAAPMAWLNARVERVSVAAEPEYAEAARDAVMAEVRASHVAHHVYRTSDTGEEIVIDDRLLLTLRDDAGGREALLEDLREKYALDLVGMVGDAYLLRVTDATGMNPVKVSNALRAEPGVADASPNILLPLVPHAPRLLPRQWYLDSGASAHPDVLSNVGIRAPEAWAITTGSPDIVLAVVDDGFDLLHPVFAGKRIHPEPFDFSAGGPDTNPTATGRDYHGTCVASIAAAPRGVGMVGVAPDCTLLPIRIGFGEFQGAADMVQILTYASQRADVINCSFGFPPTSFPPLPAAARAAISALTRTGGRRGTGVVLVFSAANDDAPTSLPAARNVNGVRFLDFKTGGVRTLPAGTRVVPGYPGIEGVITVASVSSRRRKSGYSNWGPEITLCAPSNNEHYLTFTSDAAVRQEFTAYYRGLGLVAASNRPTVAAGFSPLPDDPFTTDLREDFFTAKFGGTSGAAPVVSGVAALVLSANPALSAAQVRQILMATADTDLDPTTDLANDPNLQGSTGTFLNGHSLFFGAGKVNAARAVQRARALANPGGDLPTCVPAPSGPLTVTPAYFATGAGGVGAFATAPATSPALVRPSVVRAVAAFASAPQPVGSGSGPRVAEGFGEGFGGGFGEGFEAPFGFPAIGQPPRFNPSILPKVGENLPPSDFPRECVAVLRTVGGVRRVVGSAVLIGPRTVLTAAHVLAGSGSFSVTALTVADNAPDLPTAPGGGSAVLQGAVPIVSQVPAYPDNPEIDLVLAYLAYDSGYNGGFSPVAQVAASQFCLISGYGPVALTGAGAGVRRASKAFLNFVFPVPGPGNVPAYLRVGTRNEGAVLTQGDSGGPLYLVNTQNQRFLAGIGYKTLPLNDDGGWYTALAPYIDDIAPRIL